MLQIVVGAEPIVAPLPLQLSSIMLLQLSILLDTPMHI